MSMKIHEENIEETACSIKAYLELFSPFIREHFDSVYGMYLSRRESEPDLCTVLAWNDIRYLIVKNVRALHALEHRICELID